MREEKSLLLQEVKDKMDGSKAFFITRYKALEPNKSSQFRLKLSSSGGEFEVVKKRIFLKAAKASGITLNLKDLEGHIGIVFAHQDAIQTTKTVFDYCQEGEESGIALAVIAGRFEGQICSSKDVEAIAKLPSQEEMRSQLLAVLEAPMSQSLAVFESLLTSVMHCLENKVAQQES